jgi:hypothetical protein
MTPRSTLFVAVVAPALALAMIGAVGAADVNVSAGAPQTPGVVVQPSPPPVVVQPAPPAVVVQPPSSTTVITPSIPQVVQAEDIEATEVRAGTIYAEKIKASTVTGTVHQTGDVKVSGKGDIKAPSVVASVIYAETIKAGSVSANEIYVRELERK